MCGNTYSLHLFLKNNIITPFKIKIKFREISGMKPRVASSISLDEEVLKKSFAEYVNNNKLINLKYHAEEFYD